MGFIWDPPAASWKPVKVSLAERFSTLFRGWLSIAKIQKERPPGGGLFAEA